MKQIIVLWFSCLSLTVSAQESVSHLIIDSLQSQYLKNIRKFCLYLPPRFNSQQAYPIIVATDGQTLEEGNYKSVLDSLITAKRVKPFVLIGAYADETPACGVTVRNLEYLRSRKGNKRTQTYFQ